jgi:hypothetical protein
MNLSIVTALWDGMERDWDHDLISSVPAAATVLVNEYDLDDIRIELYYRWDARW